MDERTESNAEVRCCPACTSGHTVLEGELNGYKTARCQQCGLRYTATPPPPDELVRVYNDVYQSMELYRSKLDHLREAVRTGHSRQGFYRTRVFLDRIKPAPGDRLLEIGCGAGGFLLAAKARGWNVEGIDLSDQVVEKSRAIHGLLVRSGDVDSLDFEPGAYRAVVAWEVLEHLPDPAGLAKKVRSLLAPGGVFVCSIPNHGRKVPSLVPQRGRASLPPIHLNFWDTDSFRRYAECNGFTVDYLRPARSLRGLPGIREHPVRWALSQLLAILRLREGPIMYAILRRRGDDV